MKTFRPAALFVSLVLACVVAAGLNSSSSARELSASGSARLFIKRSPDLGNLVYVAVRLDGRNIGNILWGQNFEVAIPAGRHRLEVELEPGQYSYSPSTIVLNVQAGRSYGFMAMKKGGALVLGRL